MNREIYRKKLNKFYNEMNTLQNSPMGIYLKVVNIATLNLRYEKIDYNYSLKKHPFVLLSEIIDEQLNMLKPFKEILFCENNYNNNSLGVKSEDIEEKHKSLFNLIWANTSKNLPYESINRFKHRLEINNLVSFIKGKCCLDIGCGNGSFCFALIESGADSVKGIDYGKDSIDVANSMLRKHYHSRDVSFLVSSVYELPFDDNEFDLVIQNGVFHHLKDENKAIKEASRVTKQGGIFWYYAEGEGALRHELFECSGKILREIPSEVVYSVLHNMNLPERKIYHLMDCMNATCKKTTWDEATSRLASVGFGNFRSFKGGFEWEYDKEVISADPYCKEKFGHGIIRILADKLS